MSYDRAIKDVPSSVLCEECADKYDRGSAFRADVFANGPRSGHCDVCHTFGEVAYVEPIDEEEDEDA